MREIGSDSGKIEVSAAIPNRVMCGPEPSQTVQPGSSKRSEANCNATRFRATKPHPKGRVRTPAWRANRQHEEFDTPWGALLSLARARDARARKLAKTARCLVCFLLIPGGATPGFGRKNNPSGRV